MLQFAGVLAVAGWTHVLVDNGLAKADESDLKRLDRCARLACFAKVRYGGFLKGVYPKSSILMGFSCINHPYGGTPILGNPQGWGLKLKS